MELAFSPSLFRLNVMEELMYFVWQQRLFSQLATPDGGPLDILHPGLRNHDAGPDFFNAKVRMDGIVWVGNVEMHVRASDWYRHHHDADPAYDSVILHVVLQPDAHIQLHDGTPLRTIVMTIPDPILQRYQQLCGGQSTTPLLPGQVPTYSCISCASQLAQVPNIVIHDCLTSSCMQRMTAKMERVRDLVEAQLQGWPEAFYVILTRSLGTGVNSDAMERLARSLPYSCLLHHRDNLVQLQALLLGQAGMLQLFDAASRPAHQQQEWQLMQREYAFLRQKFSLTPLPGTVWHTGRIRPAAHPEVRLRALARLIHTYPNLFSRILEAQDPRQLQQILRVSGLGHQTVRSLIINAVIPTLFCYAQWQGNSDLLQQALFWFEELPSEENRYTRLWREAGISISSALQSQGLLQLFLHYCQPHKCMRCRIGWWVIRHTLISQP